MDYRENGTNNQQDSILQPGVKESRHIRLLKTLVGLAIIYTLYLAKSLLIPLFFSALVALLLSPLVRVARRFFIPPSLSAAALMLLLVTPFTLLGLELAEPAQRWMQSLPKIAAEVTQEIEEISDSLKKTPHFLAGLMMRRNQNPSPMMATQ